nr:hypothetical protein JVH1_6688 [Rhodococcus sp. JVH1]
MLDHTRGEPLRDARPISPGRVLAITNCAVGFFAPGSTMTVLPVEPRSSDSCETARGN